MVDAALRSGSKAQRRQSAVSRRVLLCACGLLIFFSSRREFRVEIGGLLAPIVLAPLAALALRLGLRGLRRVPRHVLISAVVLWFVFSGAVLAHGDDIGAILKLFAFLAAVIVVAAAVKGRTDFVLGASALVTGVFLVACASLLSYEPSLSGLDPIATIGNKNAYSIYALPAVLLGTHLLTVERLNPVSRVLVLVQTLTITLAIFATGNRSGWLGALTVGILVLVSRRMIRDAVAVSLIVGLVFIAMHHFGYGESFEYRIEQTRTGQTADTLRQELIVESLRIAAQHPALGVGPQNLPDVLGQKFGVAELSAHNVYAFVAAGGGVPLFLSFAALVYAVYRTRGAPPMPGDRHSLLTLAQMAIILLALRGWYTEEVLFNTSFAIGLGLALGREAADSRRSASDRAGSSHAVR